jgi:ABC-type nitrate/sulfonate/bicarbonate transport system substrate-binding protein
MFANIRYPAIIKALSVLPLIILTVIFSLSCSSQYLPNTFESVTVAYSPFESNALFMVAIQERFFVRNGIDIKLKKYDTGAASLAAVINGEARIAVGLSEFPVVRKACQGEAISILGNADKGEFIYLVGRNDSGITEPSGLKGRKIGVAKGTIAEYFLGSFLEMNGMSISDIDLVDLRTPQEWVNAVVDGDVDGVAIAQPDADTVQKQLRNNSFMWPIQGGQMLHGLIVAQNDWIGSHTALIDRFLKSMVEAEAFAAKNPTQAKSCLQRGLNFDKGYVETAWQRNEFTISLDESLIIAMEDEARWLMVNKLTEKTVIPNFLDYIQASNLEMVKPGSVRISGK